MTDNRTTELRAKLTERGIDYEVKDLPNIKFFHDTRWNANGVRWCYTEFVGATTCLTMCNEWKDCTPEQAIAATLGSDRDEIYNAGFDNGVKACLQILDGYLEYPHSAAENIQRWVDEQWEEYGA